MRLFIGIPLAATVIEELSAITLRLQSEEDGLRWSSPESWHITLQFLGNTSAEQYNSLVPRLHALRLPRLSIRLDGLGFFDRAGIFFAGVRLSPELLALQEHVVSATTPCAFVPELLPFHPHITLARSKGQDRRQLLHHLTPRIHREPDFTSFVTTEFLLYEAFLGAPASRYEIRERFPLAGN
jgi:2'-5' RNA ligase